MISRINRRLMILVASFHRKSTNPILRKSLKSPLGIRKTVYEAHTLAKELCQNSACTSMTTFSQLATSGSYSRVASQSHWQGCSVRIPDGPPDWFRPRRLATSAIAVSPGVEYSTRKEVTSMGMGLTSGGT